MTLKSFYSAVILLLSACNNNTKMSNTDIEGIKETISVSPGCYNSITNDKEWYNSGKKAPKFKGLEGIHFTISTPSKEAQEYFNQGMMLSYGFNHAEAARSFYEAIKLDSGCAMAYWGFAYVLGPNYNGGMEEDNYQRAFNAVQKAQSLSKKSTAKERSLINALATRYTAQAPKDRSALDKAYAEAMKKVYNQFPTDADVGALYAEALMNLHPWDLFEKQSKKPRVWTPELIDVLEKLIKNNPKHPGAHHFYIHALEAYSYPEKALASAALLDKMVPGSGHLLHMPSHIYINTGHYHLGSQSNLKAIEMDSIYSTACHAQGVYPLAYYPHNYHFLAATATLEGNAGLAWMASTKLQQHTAKDLMTQPEWGTLQHYYSIPYYIAVKLSMWDTILTLPRPEKNLIYPEVIWHYAKGMAFLGKKDLPKAQNELDRLAFLSADTSLQHLTIWNINNTADLSQIALKILSAEIAAKKNLYNEAILLLKEAIAIEDNLNYNEPPDWFFSVRHHLGKILLQAGKPAEAEEIYRQDLKTWKNNGWALMGLYKSLAMQKKNKEAQVVKTAFDKAWQSADIKLD